MFEVADNDIGNLSDSELRTLVARLAIAEQRRQNLPISSVTAGGQQDAPDGGIDVNVAGATDAPKPDFIPRRTTGYQVKKPDMPREAITREMRPGGKLRKVIGDLATLSGAYIIVSAQGSVTEKALQDRKNAMRDAVADLPAGAQLHVDFYDRHRLASWVNEYPGIAAWVRERSGRHLSGWRSIGNWTDAKVGEETEYLVGDKQCIIDERSKEREKLAVIEGIERLRFLLGEPGQCVRLIGLSGLGKTRLLQALFESDVGEEPLDPGLAVYTDYSEETGPTAREMARHLVEIGQRAILVVDNCNPNTHAELARICSTSGSNVSLITVEYDVRDDEPERTEVFRLEASSPDLVAAWVKRIFPHISPVDRERIAEFSDGNFRVARALAETLRKGETLGRLKSRELFLRIFQQRNEPDQTLLLAAEDLALLYSFDGEDTSDEGELATLGRIRGVTATELFRSVAELRRRGVIQVRGRWRAILPQALANPLAANALEHVPAAEFDKFSASLPPRMLRSLSRRIGYLHDSAEAQSTVARWLQGNGLLGNLSELAEHGIEILANIAPVAPEVVLAKIEAELDGSNGPEILALDNPQRWQWIQLLKALAYESHMFEDAAAALARFVAVEPSNHNNNSAESPFGELFHLHLSGTCASPEQRREAIRRLADSKDPGLRRCASLALDALLEAGHFTSSSTFDFGARPRTWGWQPKIYKDVWDWFDQAVGLALELRDQLGDVGSILARNIRNLWHYGGCYDALEKAAATLSQSAAWIEGWIAFRASLNYDGAGMPEDIRARLISIIERLQPTDLLNQARAYVLNRVRGGWDITDGEEDEGKVESPWAKASEVAQQLGRALAADKIVRSEFVPEALAEEHPQRAFECGRGLAEGAADLQQMWDEIVDAYGTLEPSARNATLLGGFLHEAHQLDPAFVSRALDTAMGDSRLSPRLPYLQARIGLDGDGIARLRTALEMNVLTPNSFFDIANGVVGNAPPELLASLLYDIAELPGGVELALDILHMNFFCARQDGRECDPNLVKCGRDLLSRVNFSEKAVFRDYGLRTVIKVSLAGQEGEDAARQLCKAVRDALETCYISSHDISHVLDGLFRVQPSIALDELLLPGPTDRNRHLFEAEFGFGTPVEKLDTSVLCGWAEIDPNARYPLLSRCISMFPTQHGSDVEEQLSPLFLELLDRAPDKAAFLGDFWLRIHPRGWSGSLADVLIGRRRRLSQLETHPDAGVRRWVSEIQAEFDRWIDSERERDRDKEESFE